MNVLKVTIMSTNKPYVEAQPSTFFLPGNV
jgi:hypothetical protein